MNICIPVIADEGLASPLSPHFGSAPYFLVVDVDTNVCRAIPNGSRHHAHGSCHPLAALRGEDLAAAIVIGLGGGALNGLLASGIRVYRASRPTAGEAIAAFKAGTLETIAADAVCAHHGRDHGHARGKASDAGAGGARLESAEGDLANRRRLFDERSQRFAAKGFDRQAAARVAAAVFDPGAGTVLDVGTGRGLLAIAIADRGAAVVTVDPDASDRELAALLAQEAGVVDRIQFVTGDAASLPYPDGHFAAAASMEVLHHLADPAPVLKEMVRTLHPTGKILLADFTREGFDLVAGVHRDEGRVHAESGVTLDAAAAILQQWGFRTVLRQTAHMHEMAVFARS